MDPVTIAKFTLSGISVFSTAVNGCLKAYQAYKLSAAFGQDWVKAQRRLFIQYVKLRTLSKEPISWFTGDPLNEQDEFAQAVKFQLVDIESHFINCCELTKKYHNIGESTLML